MQFLDNDSSEWMRKAAEDYPVKPFGMNWDAVAKQLQEEEPATEVAGFMLLRYAAMVVFFMLLSLVCNKYLLLDFDNRYAATPSYNKQHNTEADLTINKPIRHTGHSSSGVNEENGSWNVQREHSVMPTPESKQSNYVYSVEQVAVSNNESVAVIDALPGLNRENANKKVFTLSQAQLEMLSDNTLGKEGRSAMTSTKEQTGKKGALREDRLYVGFLMGPDFSTVKFQKSNGVGYNLGVIIGYKLSSRWQLESGLLLNRKSYYSDGEYFSTEKTYLPAHTYITKVDGYCDMFEIPLNVRYNITQKKQSNWFATAGVSSYLMNKEDYNYTYKRYNVEYTGNKVYKNASNNWLSALNTSIGYERGINQKIQMRLEPYLKLPLQGMGTGKLPISSAGLNIGVSYPIK
jgi:hypothetical protein